MIRTKEDLKSCLEREAETYHARYSSQRELCRMQMMKNIDITYIWRYLKSLRYTEYYRNKNHRTVIDKAVRYYWERKKNRLGSRVGLCIEPNTLGEGVIINHPNVVINRLAHVGQNCRFHGNNCIGVNKGEASPENVPKIGNGVDFGFGCVVIGGITIADNIIIGANSVVTKSFTERGITIAGNPARRIHDG